MPFCNIIYITMCRDFADFSMGLNVPPPVMNMNMNREEFEARKANMRRKQENERLGERYY
jgi:E3 ubiquitin-protein ligase RBBP6